MSFKNFNEPNAVILNDLGQPNTYGRISFYDVNTSTPKVVYLDSNLSTSGSPEQILNVSGRFDVPIYAGYGDYKVKVDKFIGSDPLNPTSADYVEIYTADWSGLAESSTSATEVFTIDTIAELRLVDPTLYPVVRVLGYYDVSDDIAPRTYQWNSLSTSTDNYGTVIKVTSIATGRFELLETPTLDVRTFGIVPNTSTNYNSQLNALINWVNSGSAKTKEVFWPKGNYKFVSSTYTMAVKNVFEKEVYFDCTTVAGTLTLNINGPYEIRKEETFEYVSSTGSVVVNFNGKGGQVDVRWFGAVLDAATDDYFAFKATIDNCADSYDILIVGPMYINQGNISEFYNKLVFQYTGNISMGSGGIINIGHSNQIIKNRNGACIEGFFQYVRFGNRKIKSSWYGAIDFTEVLDAFKTLSTVNPYVVEYDDDTTFNSAHTADNMNHIWSSGKLKINDTVNFDKANFGFNKVFDSASTSYPTFNCEISVIWFGFDATGLDNALNSAIDSNNVLNFNNYNFELPSQISITNDIEIHNMDVYSETGISISIQSNANVKIKRSKLVGTGTSISVDVAATGLIEIDSCTVSGGNPLSIIGGQTLLTNSNIITDTGTNVIAGVYKATGNLFSGGYLTIGNNIFAQGNRFATLRNDIQQSSNLIKDVQLVANSFYCQKSGATEQGYINISSAFGTNVVIQNLQITNNNFDGTASSAFEVIQVDNSTSGTFSTTGTAHSLLVKDNYKSDSDMIVPATEVSNIVSPSFTAGLTTAFYNIDLDDPEFLTIGTNENNMWIVNALWSNETSNRVGPITHNPTLDFYSINTSEVPVNQISLNATYATAFQSGDVVYVSYNLKRK